MRGRGPYASDRHPSRGSATDADAVDRRRLLATRLVAAFEGGKGVLAGLASIALLVIGPLRLQRRLLQAMDRLGIGRHGELGILVDRLDDRTVHASAVVLAGYALLHGVEAWGLWHDRAWAAWIGCIAFSALMPLEAYAWTRHPTAGTALVLALNAVIVAILARDLRRRRIVPGRH